LVVPQGTIRADRTRWPLVARREELDLFAEILDDQACRGLLVSGPAGVGKTRFADECATVAVGSGFAIGTATATRSSATIPLGALIHLLPAEAATDPVDPVRRFAGAAAAFRERAGERRFVLVVDDLHHLDATSVTLIGQLMEADVVFLVATVRTGAPIADVVSGLWRSGRMVRIDLIDLSRDATDTLLHLALAGPVESGTIAALWAASGGNVMFLRELVLGARAAGTLADDEGFWRLSGALVTTVRLVELVQARLGDVEDAGRVALELLALVGSVGLTELEAMTGRAAVEALERPGLIVIGVDGRRHQVTLAHPRYGEVLREALPHVRRRQLLLDHAARIEGLGARRREDQLRVATWRLDATGTADAALLVGAAELARYSHDLAQVERLARAALTEQPTPGDRDAAGLLLGEALHESGRFAEAETVLAAGAVETTDELVRARMTAIRARNLTWGLLRPDEALKLLRQLRADTVDSDVGDQLVAHEADVLVMSGHPAEALDLLDASLTGVDPRTRVLRALPESMALALVGRCDRAAEVSEQGYADHRALGDDRGIWHPTVHLAQRAYALTKSGRLTEALEVATDNLKRAIEAGWPLGRIWVNLNLGVVHLYAGRARTAQRFLTEADLLCRDYRYSGLRRITLTSLTMAAAWLGDEARARSAADEIDRLPAFGYDPANQILGRAWAFAAAGDVAKARELLIAAAIQARGSGHYMAEAWLLHDVVRLGAPGHAEARLAELAEMSEGEFVKAFADHAVGAARRSAALLVAATDRLEAIGAMLFAAEVATEAAAAYERAGERRAAASMHARSVTLMERCEGSRTPALLTVDAPTALTRREREIVVLAARGLTSKMIAERLYVSARTVDNHLQNAYVKLGVSSRAELAAAVADTDWDVTGVVPMPPQPSSPPR
jgi:DNA-binding NarL/FixJ family response regulator/tetratricopeptide (TPR) repeat protein